MTCPICGKPVDPGAQFVPFCSGRCRLIDLANWADEKYRIPATTHPAAEDEAEESESEK